MWTNMRDPAASKEG
uniref:Uncharacterized protein n=1 Tax=Rhizophora mucronata TaxID=61149 RepID=A0A2P2QBS7_RHIMU